MDVFEYIKAARQNGIPLTKMDINIYMRQHAPKEVRERYGYHHIIEDIDPQEILDFSNNYLDSREPCCQ